MNLGNEELNAGRGDMSSSPLQPRRGFSFKCVIVVGTAITLLAVLCFPVAIMVLRQPNNEDIKNEAGYRNVIGSHKAATECPRFTIMRPIHSKYCENLLPLTDADWLYEKRLANNHECLNNDNPNNRDKKQSTGNMKSLPLDAEQEKLEKAKKIEDGLLLRNEGVPFPVLILRICKAWIRRLCIFGLICSFARRR